MFRVQLPILIAFLLFVCLLLFFVVFCLFVFSFSLTIRNISWILPFSIQINISNSNKKGFSQSLVRETCRIEFSVSNIRRFRIVCLFEALVNFSTFYAAGSGNWKTAKQKGRDTWGRSRGGSVEPAK